MLSLHNPDVCISLCKHFKNYICKELHARLLTLPINAYLLQQTKCLNTCHVQMSTVLKYMKLNFKFLDFNGRILLWYQHYLLTWPKFIFYQV